MQYTVQILYCGQSTRCQQKNYNLARIEIGFCI